MEHSLVASRDNLFHRFAELGIAVSTKEHPPVFTVEEARALRGAIPGGHCKNLFLKDKKGAIWLIVALEDTAIDLKSLPAKIGSGRLSFGSAELMQQLLGVEPGSVTPFGLINDHERRVNVVLEEQMMRHELLNYHPLSNNATTTIRSADLLRFIDACGHQPKIVPLA
ncbi:prolyl-tRNA synthetase associated domain-containing protein [Rhodoligotrophos ferricapiens]|uniref:prolyl-tRNA synthetase associated domain-containing protein n=1 Tax=Rhodoligotrophos ferricapiens TaxID=3069264 RepID=UPI00315CD010